MSYQASIHHVTTGDFLLRCNVEAHDIHEAEYVAISKAALTMRGHPREMDVRHLHQCAPHPSEWGFIDPAALSASSGAR